MTRRCLGLACLFHALAAPAAEDAVVWRTEIDGGASRDDHALSVAIDGNGNVIAAGDFIPAGNLSVMAVAKLDGASGAVLWQQRVAGTGNSFGSGAEAVAIGATGDAYLAGTLDMEGSYQDFAVVRLDGETGAPLWRGTLNAGPFDNDQANAIALDGEGGVIAGGYIVRGGLQRFTVVKLSAATGDVVWRRELSDSLPFRTQANAVVVDSQGDVIAAGSIAQPAGAEDFTVVKLDGDTGATIWDVRIDGTGHYQDEAMDIALDGNGGVLVSGFIFGALTLQDFAVVKLDAASGDELWRRTIDGEEHWVNIGESVAVDSNGDVVAGGELYRTSAVWADFSVVKLDGATGEPRWLRTRGTQAGTSTLREVVIAPGDEIVAAGEIPKRLTKTELTVVRLEGATGQSLGGVSLNGTDNWFDSAFDVAIAGNAIVTAGWLINQGTGADFTVVRLR